MNPTNARAAGLIAAALLAGTACAPSAPAYPPAYWAPPPMAAGFYPAPAAPPPSAPAAPQPAPAPPAPPTEREKVAVLPLEEGSLFRAERAELRQLLATRLASIAAGYSILPLAEVDAKLRPISSTTGTRCAFEGEPKRRRAEEQGWLTTNVFDVGSKDRDWELWVEIRGWRGDQEALWTAPWDRKLALLDRYRASIAALARKDGGGVLGGLSALGWQQGALQEGTITLCERQGVGACDPISASWKDKAGELAACFAGEDDILTDLLIQGDGAQARCEIDDLDALNATDGREGPREACLCKALSASPAMRAKAGRRSVRVRFEAADLAGKPRPELRVIEASINFDSEVDWHSIRAVRDGKTTFTSLRRMVVDNLDGLAAPLARCNMAKGSVVVADIDAREDGAVSDARVAGGLKKGEAACVEKALRRGAFSCSDDGKAAKVRIAIAWPP